MASRMLRRSPITLLVVSFLLASLATGQGIGSFTSPGPQISAGLYAISLTFQYGDVQDFVWTVDLTGVRLSLWQQGNASGIDNPGTEDILDYNNTEEVFVWNGIPSQDLDQGQIFFLQIYDAAVAIGDALPIATSEYFNISDSAAVLAFSTVSSGNVAIATAASSSLASSAGVSSSTRTDVSSFARTSATSATAGATTANAKASSTSAPASLLSKPKTTHAPVIGLGVGLGCTALMALLAAGLFFRHYKRQRQHTVYAPGGGHESHTEKYIHANQEIQ